MILKGGLKRPRRWSRRCESSSICCQGLILECFLTVDLDFGGMIPLEDLGTWIIKLKSRMKDALGKVLNRTNLIAIFGRLLEILSRKRAQKEILELVKPVARTREQAFEFRKSKSGSCKALFYRICLT